METLWVRQRPRRIRAAQVNRVDGERPNDNSTLCKVRSMRRQSTSNSAQSSSFLQGFATVDSNLLGQLPTHQYDVTPLGSAEVNDNNVDAAARAPPPHCQGWRHRHFFLQVTSLLMTSKSQETLAPVEAVERDLYPDDDDRALDPR